MMTNELILYKHCKTQQLGLHSDATDRHCAAANHRGRRSVDCTPWKGFDRVLGWLSRLIVAPSCWRLLATPSRSCSCLRAPPAGGCLLLCRERSACRCPNLRCCAKHLLATPLAVVAYLRHQKLFTHD